MKQVGEHGSGARGRLLPRLAALGVLAMAFGAPWPLAQAATGGEVSLVSCAPDTYKCTANDAQGAISVTAADIPSCVSGEWVDVPVTINATTSGNNERMDIGAWFLSSTPGQCQNVMTTATNNIAGQFMNVDGDTCGDMSGSATASQTFTVKVQCNPDANGVVTFPTLAYWSNNKDPNTCNPYPASKPKCTTGTTTVNVTELQGKITVKKIAANAGTTEFGFAYGVSGGATQSFSLTAGGTPMEIEVVATRDAVNYTIAETPLAHWQFSSAICTSTNGGTWSNAPGSSAVTVPVSFAHSDITCEFTNAEIPPSNTVKLVKALTVDDPGQFTYTLGAAPATASSGGSGEKTSGTFQANTTVNFSEAAGTATSLLNYDTSWRCVGADADKTLVASGTGPSGTFQMPAYGVTCTITNARIQRLVKINKLLTPDGDGGKFALLVNGAIIPGASAVGNYTDETGLPVAAGSVVTVSERGANTTSLDSYNSTLSCGGVTIEPNHGTSGTFTMPDGAGDAVVCTFTNDRKPVPPAVAPIPTTSPEGLAALALMMVGVAGWAARRRSKRGK